MSKVLGVVSILLASPALAQSPIYPAAQGAVGLEARSLGFSEGIRLSDASQTAFRLVGGVPVGSRLFVDVSTAYAVTHIASLDGTEVNASGPTDTHVRAAYTLGRDAGVFSLQVDLPTGEEQVPREEVPLLRAMAQNFLPFPVSTYGRGAGVTGAASFARRVAGWSLGAAASMRYVSEYSPFSDFDDRYAPGLEGRLRVGARRRIGYNTSVLVGFTVSTFGTDELTGTRQFSYRPGNRYIGEASVSRQIGRSTLRTFAWVFWRSADDSSGVTVEKPKERILYGGAIWSLPVTGRIVLDPGLDARSWRSEDGGSGRMVGLEVTGRVRLTSALTLAPSLRLERGRIALIEGIGADFTGVSASLLVWVRR
ncbi:MAG: hypothetical protein PVF27_02810 [Gemmatimonadales bacterium]